MIKSVDIFPIGSCRVNDPIRSVKTVNIPKLIYTHSAKEALQQVLVLKGKKVWPPFYEVEYNAEFKRNFESMDVLFIEICSSKVFSINYAGEDFYLNNAQAENYASNFTISESIQSYDELKKDIGKIADEFNGRIFLVGHTFPKLPAETEQIFPFLPHLYKSRRDLSEKLLRVAEELERVEYIEVNDVYEVADMRDILKRKSDGPDKVDLNHYDPKSFSLIGDFFIRKIEE
jgi:hypothetical protein